MTIKILVKKAVKKILKMVVPETDILEQNKKKQINKLLIRRAWVLVTIADTLQGGKNYEKCREESEFYSEVFDPNDFGRSGRISNL